jgi:hypothetical protein
MGVPLRVLAKMASMKMVMASMKMVMVNSGGLNLQTDTLSHPRVSTMTIAM